MKFKAEMGHWSSIVGNSVHLIGEDGRFLGQIAIMCQDDRLREKDAQTAICEKICAALNADLCASGQQVRALVANLSVWAGKAHPDQQLVDLAHVLAILDSNPAALTPAPQPEGEAMPTCVACEDNQKHPNIPCAPPWCTPPQPGEAVAEAAKVLVAAWDADELPVSDPDPMLPEFIAALRALKGGE